MTLEYELLAQLIDKNDCRYDHNGKCQEHSLHSFPCPHERAKLLLANPKDESALEAHPELIEALDNLLAEIRAEDISEECILNVLRAASLVYDMAQSPVVPVSEDVETISRALRNSPSPTLADHQSCNQWLSELKSALAALDRLAAAAGRKP